MTDIGGRSQPMFSQERANSIIGGSVDLIQHPIFNRRACMVLHKTLTINLIEKKEFSNA